LDAYEGTGRLSINPFGRPFFEKRFDPLDRIVGGHELI
jgi:hypothetical protein